MGLASVVTTSIGLGIRTHQVAVEKTMDLRPEMQTVDVTHAGQSASYERACVGLSPSNLSHFYSPLLSPLLKTTKLN